MDTPLPERADVEVLLSFLPTLDGMTDEGIVRWNGGTPNENGEISMPWPSYAAFVSEFFSAASADCWCDRDYDPTRSATMLKDHQQIASASLQDVRAMLTLCVRGERFCDGHWGAMIKAGHIGRLLKRLQALAEA